MLLAATSYYEIAGIIALSLYILLLLIAIHLMIITSATERRIRNPNSKGTGSYTENFPVETKSITVNGKRHSISVPLISYNDILHLADLPIGTIASVTFFWRGPSSLASRPDLKEELTSIMCPGDQVQVRPDMRFSAVVTNNA